MPRTCNVDVGVIEHIARSCLLRPDCDENAKQLPFLRIRLTLACIVAIYHKYVVASNYHWFVIFSLMVLENIQQEFFWISKFCDGQLRRTDSF